MFIKCLLMFTSVLYMFMFNLLTLYYLFPNTFLAQRLHNPRFDRPGELKHFLQIRIWLIVYSRPETLCLELSEATARRE